MSLSFSPLRRLRAALSSALASTLASAVIPALCTAPLLATPTDAVAQHARVIVKLRAHSDLLSGRAAAMGTVPATGEPARMRKLGERVGVVMQDGRRISERMQVAQASGITSEALARKLSSQADVEWVAVDRRVRAAALPPSDPLYPSGGGGTANQWYLRAPTGTVVSATNAVGAWALTRGASNVVVAVIDTGVRFDHPDLQYKLLPGYDMIQDPWVANDNTGRDSDATDVGDRLTQAEIDANRSVFDGCSAEETNSWHGTKVAGIVGAQTDNARGVAGIGWNVRILPVRGLGRCGGYESDIAAAMRWAAGLSVPGVPDNPAANRARVINLSLGSESAGSCGSVYQSAIDEVTAAGAVVVVSAGNNNGPVYAPGNCANVITVGGVRHDGTKSGFSAYGSEVTLSAPAGNCVGGSGCQYTIVTTTNAGSTSPVIGTDAYTNAFNYAAGTSFSAPLVSGTVALMLSVRPELDYASVKSLLIGNVTPWSATFSSYANSCPTFVDSSGICRCDTSTCGAGMLNTQAAVAAAQAIVFSGEQESGQPAAGDTLSFTWQTSALGAASVTGLPQWSVIDGAGLVTATGPSTANPYAVTANSSGRFTIRLVLPTSAGLRTFTRSIDIGPAPNLAPQPVTAESATVSRSSGGGGGGALDAGWLLGLIGMVALAPRRRQAG